MLQQRQQQRFPPITKPQRLKLLQDVTQQPYGIGVVHYYPEETNKSLNSGKKQIEDDDDDYNDPDPGLEAIEKYQKERTKRVADDKKEELDRVLKRVDNTLNSYEYSVQSTLIQGGMTREEINSVEHVADIRELEYLLNDSLAKQRYKQRLMVFIVGQAEHASEKTKLLQQIGQFFVDQKQNFSGTEFNDFDDTGETSDEIETTLQSFDVKDCYHHVKTLGNRINELNEDIVQFLIQNTGTKQTKVMVERGKRKLAQVTKEAKEQLAELQSKIEMANAEMMAKDSAIQTLEKDMETIRTEIKTTQENLKKIQDELKRRETEIKFFKRRNNELEDIVDRYKKQMGDLPGLASGTSQSETDDGDDASRMNLETIDETESRYEKESISSRTGKEQVQTGTVPAGAADPATNNTTKPAPPPIPPPPAASKGTKKSKTRDKTRRSSFRSKKEAANQNGAEDPGEIYLRSQQLLESLLADKSENAPDLNVLFKPARGVDLNIVTIDNLPTAFTNLRKFAVNRVRELLKDLETKESANKETVQVLKQEFVEHKTTYEKERLLYFLSLDPDDNTLQEEQNALTEKADHAHKLQIKAQKTAEEALSHLELFMVEQEKLDQQDVVRQTELVHRHSIVVNNVTGANITPPERTGPIEEPANDRLSPNPKRTTPSKNQWQKLSSVGNAPSKAGSVDEPKATIYETAQALKRLSSNPQKTPPQAAKAQRSDSVERRQQQGQSPLLPKTTQELLRKKSSIEQPHQPSHDRSTSSSRRISMTINDDTNPLSKVITPQPYERTSSIQSRSLTRANSINPANKDQEKSSSGERSYHTSAAQSRRVSIGLNRSPVRAEELERVLTKLVNEEIEALENYRRTSVKRRTSLREKYMSLLEEKKHELDDLKQQADVTLSRPTTSTKDRRQLDSLENSTGLAKQHSSFSRLESSGPNEPPVKYDQQQQTSPGNSRPSSGRKEKSPLPPPQIIQSDQYKVPFFHLYETIYKFRHSITNLLEQNQFLPLADRLDMIKQISSSSSDDNPTDDFVDNSERVLKDTVKVLQTCMATIHQNENKQKQPSPEQSKTTVVEHQQSSVIEQKELIIDDLNYKYQHITEVLNQNKRKHQEELIQSQRTIDDQQKLVHNFQQELMRLQRRLSKMENERVVQPSVLFTRLDVERNEQTLKQAVDKGKVSETTVNEIKETMEDYITLPCRQFSNIVKRYIQHRKAADLKNRIQKEPFDNETKSVMEKMESYYERRSGQISDHIASIRQHRSTLARTLTDKFDHLEHDYSIFLIRPVYSYQGRSAVQSYLENEKRQLKENDEKESQHQTQSRLDHRSKTIEESFPPAKQASARPRSSEHGKPSSGNTNELSRLQEFDIQRTLKPVSQNSVPHSVISSNNGTDSTVNLRTYVPLSRPSIGGDKKSNDFKNPVLSTELSTLSVTNPGTAMNSTHGSDIRRTSPPLPPIKSSLTSSTPRSTDEKQNNELVPTDRTVTDKK